MTIKLTHKLLLEATGELSSRDRALAKIVERFGPPPMWGRKPGFATLVKIILEQQVSLASADSLFRKLESSVPEVAPEHIHELSVSGLRQIGFTRQKASYCHGLAEVILSGQINLNKVTRMDDATAHHTLLQIKGIGPWTANIYLLMALKRPDIWPDGDLALAESARQVKGLAERPNDERLNRMASRWKPWRSVAARILWHHYLCDKGENNI